MEKINWKWLAGTISAMTLIVLTASLIMRFLGQRGTGEDVTWVG